ncbi:MAG: helix-turn-helix transcriptional regulator [Candidatus Thorarchaeota archaeon]
MTTRAAKSQVQDQVLTLLHEGSSYGYEIMRLLRTEYDTLRLNTLYRWLSELEGDGLVVSETRSRPNGPERRVYSITWKGRERTLVLLRKAIRLVYQFYEDYQRFMMGEDWPYIAATNPVTIPGRVLYTEFPRITDKSASLIELLQARSETRVLDIVGDDAVARKAGIRGRSHAARMTELPFRQGHFGEVWLNGLPTCDELPAVLAECQRILKKQGVLRIIPSHVFPTGTFESRLDEFIEATVNLLFPENGIVGINSLCADIRGAFGNCIVDEVFPRVYVFSATK